MATKSLKEKWLSMVQSAREKEENEVGGSSTVTGCERVDSVSGCKQCRWVGWQE